MRFTALLCVAVLPAFSNGIQPRTAPADYAAHAEANGIRIAAETLSPDNVRNMFATDLSNYVVVEVAVWPAAGKSLDLSPVDFSLRLDGDRAPVRPVSPKTIAGVIQRKGESRRDDIVLYPTVGVSTGTWGTGVGVGVGVGMGGGRPGPASTDRDRRTMELELDDQGLPEGGVQKPVAGYLYFPAGSRSKKLTSGEFIFDGNGANLRMTLPIDRK